MIDPDNREEHFEKFDCIFRSIRNLQGLEGEIGFIGNVIAAEEGGE